MLWEVFQNSYVHQGVQWNPLKSIWFLSLVHLAAPSCLWNTRGTYTGTHTNGGPEHVAKGAEISWHFMEKNVPSGNLTLLLKITIFNGKIHYKWSFSIATLNYQRVVCPLVSSCSFMSKHQDQTRITHDQTNLGYTHGSKINRDKRSWKVITKVKP